MFLNVHYHSEQNTRAILAISNYLNVLYFVLLLYYLYKYFIMFTNLNFYFDFFENTLMFMGTGRLLFYLPIS